MSPEEASMNGDYVFLCGVMWCAYGQQDAASELLRAVNSADPDLSALASAMLGSAEGGRNILWLNRRFETSLSPGKIISPSIEIWVIR